MLPKIRHASILLAILVVACGLSAAITRYLPFVALAERWVADFRIAALSPPESQNDDIIVVTVTEETLSRFSYRSPLDRRFLGEVVATLEARGVRAIGLDILFDQATEPDKDQFLRSTLASVRIPVVASYARTEERLTEAQVTYLDDFLPPGHRGFVNLVKDGLSVVRWIYPGRRLPDGRFVRGFAGALAELLGVRPPEDQIPIAWRAAPDDQTTAFRAFPAHTITVLPAAWFKDKIVLIGADLGQEDRHRTPFAALGGTAGMAPGVVVHAHALAQLLDGRRSPELGSWGRVLLIALVGACGIALAFIDVNLAARLGLTVLSFALILIGGFAAYRYGWTLIPLIGPGLALGIGLWMTDAYRGRSERRQKRFIKDAFSRFVSPALVDRLVADPSALALGGENRVMSYIFTDIEGFTSLSEKAGAAAVSELLNRYLSGACEVVFRYGGTVTDFIGDAVFAMFNAPILQDDHARRALDCARDLDAFSESFRREALPRKLGLGITRIGIHTGTAAVGNMGADTHFKYSPIGDSVNTASRIEGLNKHFGTRVCVSGETLKQCQRSDVPARALGRVVLKGKKEPLEIYEVLDVERDCSPYMARYREAYAMLDGATMARGRCSRSFARITPTTAAWPSTSHAWTPVPATPSS